jgi:hypothetical protein
MPDKKMWVHSSHKWDGNKVVCYFFHSLPLGFSQRIMGDQNRALAKFFGASIS